MFFVGLSAVHDEREGDVLLSVEDGDKVVELVYQSDLSAAEDSEVLVILRKDVLLVEEDLARGGTVDAAEDVEES